jgi:hypothetical protein
VADLRDPSAYAAAIEKTRDDFIEVARRCPDGAWREPLSDEDPRSVGVVVDHVADAYDYIGSFITRLQAGEAIQVDAEVIHGLNAAHAGRAAAVSRDEAVDHLGQQGDALVQLVAGLSDDDLAANDGRMARLAEIAAGHAVNHQAEIESAIEREG